MRSVLADCSLTLPDLQRLTATLLRWRDLDPVLPSASV